MLHRNRYRLLQVDGHPPIPALSTVVASAALAPSTVVPVAATDFAPVAFSSVARAARSGAVSVVYSAVARSVFAAHFVAGAAGIVDAVVAAGSPSEHNLLLCAASWQMRQFTLEPPHPRS